MDDFLRMVEIVQGIYDKVESNFDIDKLLNKEIKKEDFVAVIPETVLMHYRTIFNAYREGFFYSFYGYSDEDFHYIRPLSYIHITRHTLKEYINNLATENYSENDLKNEYDGIYNDDPCVGNWIQDKNKIFIDTLFGDPSKFF